MQALPSHGPRPTTATTRFSAHFRVALQFAGVSLGARGAIDRTSGRVAVCIAGSRWRFAADAQAARG